MHTYTVILVTHNEDKQERETLYVGIDLTVAKFFSVTNPNTSLVLQKWSQGRLVDEHEKTPKLGTWVLVYSKLEEITKKIEWYKHSNLFDETVQKELNSLALQKKELHHNTHESIKDEVIFKRAKKEDEERTARLADYLKDTKLS
jgi:hypothetical protein